MSEYTIPGKYSDCDAEFIRRALSKSAETTFDKTAGIRVSVRQVEVGCNSIMLFEEYKIIVTSNDCVNDELLKTWVTEEIVVGYCRAAARENGVF